MELRNCLLSTVMAEGEPSMEEQVVNFNFKHLEIDEDTREKLQRSKEVNILLVGCYQVGKSALINAIFFEQGKKYERAKEGELMKPCTDEVSPYTLVIGDNDTRVTVNIYDSPGLQDGEKDDCEHLENIKKACPNFHLMIYCTKMGEPVRVKALRVLHSGKGNMVIALTFANQVQPANPNEEKASHFKKKLSTKKIVIGEALEKIGLARNENIYPVGSAGSEELPTTNNWQVDFLVGCLIACELEGKRAMLQVACKNKHFLKSVVEKVKDKVVSVGDKVKETLASAREKTKDKVVSGAEKVKEKVVSMGHAVKDKAVSAGEKAKQAIEDNPARIIAATGASTVAGGAGMVVAGVTATTTGVGAIVGVPAIVGGVVAMVLGLRQLDIAGAI